MTTQHFRARLIVAVLGVLLCAPAALSQPAATGPFAKVPALPTVCYAETDPFIDKLDAAREAMQAEWYKQNDVNAKIEEDLQNIDPMEMASRMQQWMMSNPQEAMKYAQAAQATGEESQTAVPELNAAEMKFDTEQKDLVARYKAALEQTHAPAEARMAALVKKLEAAGECGFGDTECAMPDWAWVEYDVIQKQRDAAYQASCPQWWGATGQVHGYLKRYRDWLVTKYIPAWKANDDARLTQYAIMNTPAASWKSTIPYQSADKYMRVTRELFINRETGPNCNAKGCRG